MVSEVVRRTGEDLSPLLHVSVSIGVLTSAFGTPCCIIKTSGAVATGRVLIDTKSVIELKKEHEIWLPLNGNLLLGNEHFTFSYRGDVMYMIRTLEQFPS
ncbi:hypothetical protein K2P47_03245 [Patescibacteria group bacterium]|nr:hypothetical protein [Patescibacteria group bacterium]